MRIPAGWRRTQLQWQQLGWFVVDVQTALVLISSCWFRWSLLMSVIYSQWYTMRTRPELWPLYCCGTHVSNKKYVACSVTAVPRTRSNTVRHLTPEHFDTHKCDKFGYVYKKCEWHPPIAPSFRFRRCLHSAFCFRRCLHSAFVLEGVSILHSPNLALYISFNYS